MALSRSCKWATLWFVLLLMPFGAFAQDDYDYYDEDEIEIVEPSTPLVNQQEDYLQTDLEPKPFDRETWNKNREGMGYGEKSNEPKQKSKKDQDGKTRGEGDDDTSSSRPMPLFSGLGTMFQVVLIIGVIALLALIVFAIVRQGWLISDKGINANVSAATLLENLEENLHESDLDKALRLAVEANNYRLAIRIYYLTIIKELSAMKWIHWKRDKTNGQYVREMGEKPQGQAFRQLTLAFERVWYSDEEIIKRHYEVLSPQFQSFINSLKKR